MMIGKFPRVPKVGFPLIDVRDCAAIHVAAMTAQEASGRRLLATGQTLWFKDIAAILKAEYPSLKKLPQGEIPNFVLYAKSEGRQIQSVLEEAVEMMLKEKQGYVMRPEVKAAYEASLEQFDDLYKRLAQ